MSSRCAAITLNGTRCSRKAMKNSIYCWQHQNYDPTVTASYIPKGVLKAEIKNPEPTEVIITRTRKPEVAKLVETKTKGEMFQLPNLYLRVDDMSLDNLDLTSNDLDQLTDLGAVGPVILVCPVGRYDDTIIDFDIEFKSGEYTFDQIISDVYDLYSRNTTLEEIDHLIRVSRTNKDQLSEGLYVEMRLQIKRGNDVPLYELNGNRLKVDRITLDKNGKYYLRLSNI
jgi:hypothetical protein